MLVMGRVVLFGELSRIIDSFIKVHTKNNARNSMFLLFFGEFNSFALSYNSVTHHFVIQLAYALLNLETYFFEMPFPHSV